jgi:dipeptidyl-peptidase 4
MMKISTKTYFIAIIFLVQNQVIAQKLSNEITVEQIWKNYEYFPASPPEFRFTSQDEFFTTLEDNSIKVYKTENSELVKTLFSAGNDVGKTKWIYKDISDYLLDNNPFDDTNWVLFTTEEKAIYRHSTAARHILWNKKTNETRELYSGKSQRYPTFSPDNKHIAFLIENDLFVHSLDSMKTIQVTSDGSFNKIINGGTDWVYEEEFSFSRAYWWSPDGKKIAFLRFDESEVPEYGMDIYGGGLYPERNIFKYPKVGEKNSKVSCKVYSIPENSVLSTEIPNDPEQYLPRIVWTKDPNVFILTRLNRFQNHLQLLSTNATTGKSKVILEEKSKTYIDINDHLTFLPDGKKYLWLSEKDGFKHLYLRNLDDFSEKKLTNGNWEVTDFYGYDEKNNQVFFQSNMGTPIRKKVYQLSLAGGTPKALTEKEGVNTATFSPGFKYYLLNYSNIATAPVYSLINVKTGVAKILEANEKIAQTVFSKTTKPEFFQLTTSENITLNAWIIKPPKMNPKKKHPLLMYFYGGPGSQEVMDEWQGPNYMWFQMLAQKGYVVACVDNRGTGGRGQDFKKMTYLQLGKYETIDQLEAAKWFAKQKYIDGSRIGMFGWSFGGYLSSSCILKGEGLIKAAIAVAPVTNWKWYDTIYTERFMKDEKENASGYKDNSPIYFADKLKGNYLIVHGTGDDNVHFQHSAEMIKALQAAGKNFEMEIYPNKAHGISGGLTRYHLYNKMTDFIQRKL